MGDAQNAYQRLLRRHEREKRELQNRIMAMKSEVLKSDKKKRKQVLHEVNRLEAELEQKQKQELDRFRNRLGETGNIDSISEDLAKMGLENVHPRYLRAKKRRERKAAFKRGLQDKLTQARVDQLTNYHHEEEKRLAIILESRNLEMKEIPADGHCMYRAIQDQLTSDDTVHSLRIRAADYMRSHADDFLPFFCDSKSGIPFTYDNFMAYCNNIVYSTMWGGQVELRALSHALQTPIEVIQADSPILVIGEEYTQKPITLVYLHYSRDHGEHYNSVKPLEMEEGAVGGCPMSLS